MVTSRVWRNTMDVPGKSLFADDQAVINYFCSRRDKEHPEPYYLTSNKEMILKSDIKTEEDLLYLVEKINEDFNRYQLEPEDWIVIEPDPPEGKVVEFPKKK